ncbi:MAG: MFS transporter [Geminicoccaceae bacterium]|nr:MFS transporter [Geminicoccaceae bacterium]
MLRTIASNWALLLGIGVFMLGHGLQGTLLGVRANIQGFPTAVTGIVMAGYSLGYLLGALWVERLLVRVGHVRVFAAASALASAAIVVHAVILDPFSWFALRVLTGLSMAGIYMVAESWLNAAASNADRGRLLSLYMIVVSGCFAGGQILLNLGSPATTLLFILASVLLSVATVPLLLSSVPAPIIQAPKRFGFRDLYRVSPLSFVGMTGVGLTQAAFLGVGAVFADLSGLSVAGVSTFMALGYLGGVVMQWPIGRLSDRFDRRRVLTGVNVLAAGTMALAVLGLPFGTIAITLAFFVYGGLAMPLYALCLAHANDHLSDDQRISASGTLAFVYAAGSVGGPIFASAAMQAGGAFVFPVYLGVVHAGIGAFALYRMTRRTAPPLERQGQHLNVPTPALSASTVVTAFAQERAMEAGRDVDRPEIPAPKIEYGLG